MWRENLKAIITHRHTNFTVVMVTMMDCFLVVANILVDFDVIDGKIPLLTTRNTWLEYPREAGTWGRIGHKGDVMDKTVPLPSNSTKLTFWQDTLRGKPTSNRLPLPLFSEPLQPGRYSTLNHQQVCLDLCWLHFCYFSPPYGIMVNVSCPLTES